MSNHENEKDKLIEDHEYDGIKELDNPLPGWWLMTFYITIVFAVGYFLYYQVFGGPTLEQELKTNMASIEEMQQTHQAEESSQFDARAVVMNKERVAAGKEIFQTKCFACHGDKAQGIIGPNLTDDYWIHGDGTVSAIRDIVTKGVPDKGMPPWGGQLTSDQIIDVAAYVYSLHGSNPEGAKPPQGEKVQY